MSKTSELEEKCARLTRERDEARAERDAACMECGSDTPGASCPLRAATTERDALRARVVALETALRDILENCGCSEEVDTQCANCDRAEAALAQSPTPRDDGHHETSYLPPVVSKDFDALSESFRGQVRVITELQAERGTLRTRVQELETALRGVEWGYGNFGLKECPECTYVAAAGHHPECAVGAALAPPALKSVAEHPCKTCGGKRWIRSETAAGFITNSRCPDCPKVSP